MKTNKTKSQKSSTRIWENNIYALKILFGPTPLYGLSIIVEAIRHNLVNFLEQTICVFMVLKAIEEHKPYTVVVKVIVLFLLLDFVAAVVCNTYEQKIKLKYLPIAQQALKIKLYEKAKDVDFKSYDNPVYYNDYCMVVSEADKAVERAEQLLRMFFGSTTVLICYGTFFLTQDITSVLFVMISFVLRTLFSNMSNKLRYELRMQEVPLERKRDYIKRLFYLKDYAKEIRLNKQITEGFHKQFDEVQDEIYSIHKKVALKKFLLDFTAKYLVSDFLLDIVYVLYLIIRASIYHLISYSQVVVLYNSAAGLRRGFSTITDLGSYTVETSLYIDKIRAFLDSEAEIISKKTRELPSKPALLECKDVSFGYDANGLIIKNVNLVIHPGEKIALVGYNGAGKTSLIKLILRLYDPSEGAIYLDGTDIREYDLLEYRNYIGVVFQDFQIYATNIEQNVIMDQVKMEEENQVTVAIKKGGFFGKLNTLPKGLKTEITNEFEEGGTELSGGEAQKLAVSRSFYRNGGMMLLDEPSAALDPIAEYELNCAMNEMSEQKNVIYISHRLSTIRHADRIYVMNEGRIVEEGNHATLLDKQGIYSMMWNTQAMRYW
ncbi:MAG TPA: ABC transporter ATP-binding protein [Mobilitalea sp.]|nr:ABC transporter ATP-binding protein [Mobilitalea sp.]